MEGDLDIIRKIREKEDQEEKATEDLRKKLKAELEHLQKNMENKISSERDKLSADYKGTIDRLTREMEAFKSGELKKAQQKADSIKIEMTQKDLKDLIRSVLKKYLEE